MKELFLVRAVLMVITLTITLFDVMLWLTGHGGRFPHRNALLTCALMWFATILFPQNSDDDWAGQF